MYALKSLRNADLYIGFSTDLRQRFHDHNGGNVKATKGYRPWKLVYYEAFLDETDARRREKQLKQHKAKSDLIKQIEVSLKVNEQE
jgi:putative endonuclease